MKFDELMRLKALQLKAMNTGQNVMEAIGEQQLELPEVREELKLRQVCAMVSPGLFSELEGVCELLSVSKRAFITGALIDALDKTKAILDEVQPFEESH